MLGYGAGMSEMAEIPAISDNVESVVSAELAHGDGVLMLQAHNNEVHYRNFWLRKL